MASLTTIGTSRGVTVDVAAAADGIQLALDLHGVGHGAIAYDGPLIIALTDEETDALIDQLVATQQVR